MSQNDLDMNMNSPSPPADDQSFFNRQDQSSFDVESNETTSDHCAINWGSCFPFFMDKNKKNALIVIGPHWPLFVYAFFMFFSISAFMILVTQITNQTFNIQLATLVVNIAQPFSYLLVFLKNPGVSNTLNKLKLDTGSTQTRKSNQPWYCKKCKVVQYGTTQHCEDCQVCITNMDHHCPWTGKCIGSGNIKEFYLFLLCTLGFLVYNIIVGTSFIDQMRK